MPRSPYFNKKHENLKQRTKGFGLRVICMWKSLPANTLSEVLGKQLLRCATSVAANYRAACGLYTSLKLAFFPHPGSTACWMKQSSSQP